MVIVKQELTKIYKQKLREVDMREKPIQNSNKEKIACLKWDLFEI